MDPLIEAARHVGRAYGSGSKITAGNGTTKSATIVLDKKTGLRRDTDTDPL
jgi:hypothetical protein